MLPVLFTIGPYNVYTFGLLLALAFVLSTFIIWKYAKEELKEEEYLDAFLYTSIATLVSARVVYILFNFSSFGLNILKYIVVRETPGLSLLGGLFGGFIYLWWYSRRKKFNFLHLLDLFSLAASLVFAFTKIGEQLGGAGFGRETGFILGVKIVGQTGRYHPVELYEAIIFLLLFILLLFIYKRVRLRILPEGLPFYLFAEGTLLSLVLLEFLKVYRVYLFGLSSKQIVALILTIIVAKPLLSILRGVFQKKYEVPA